MKNEIVLYRPNEVAEHIEVRLDADTVWLTQAQIAELFGTKRQAITRHLKNIFVSNELEENSVSSILELTAADGKKYDTKIYNLDAILSVGYRVNSANATLFRRWATDTLKEYLLKGYAINSRMNRIEDKFDALNDKVEEMGLQLKTQQLPTQGVYVDGQVFDAYEQISKIIRSAKQSIVLIDNYIDDSVLVQLSKKSSGVKVLLLTSNISSTLRLDVQKANAQYGGFTIKQYTKSHDRFIIVDGGREVYHVGASLKDLGKKLFAFTKMDKESVSNLINAVSSLI
ncbi:MAG: virulence RhuM family protein [Oscillospiraceae bacterium]|nr:virulence RhuM family protein [Oscillospiraceae bacterium]MCL2279746.1 virulence RhuM family protein [Oscillospiraceae bacterium]